jgi:hypothetical protein
MIYLMNHTSRSPIFFDNPAIYRIEVLGQLDPNMSDYFEGMAISQTSGATDFSITTLEGELCDQAALAGVLNTLYEMHLPLISVKCRNIGFDAEFSCKK